MHTADLLTRLDDCPRGRSRWRQYEDVCIDILKYLFVPPLQEPRVQPRNSRGVSRRDAIFPNRIVDITTVWGQLRQEVNARMILFEFKNYDKEEISSDEIDKVNGYLTSTIGNFGILISTKEPLENAKIKRNHIFGEYGKVILLLTSDHLKEMIFMKERGDDPAHLIMEQVELFYTEYI